MTGFESTRASCIRDSGSVGNCRGLQHCGTGRHRKVSVRAGTGRPKIMALMPGRDLFRFFLSDSALRGSALRGSAAGDLCRSNSRVCLSNVRMTNDGKYLLASSNRHVRGLPGFRQQEFEITDRQRQAETGRDRQRQAETGRTEICIST